MRDLAQSCFGPDLLLQSPLSEAPYFCATPFCEDVKRWLQELDNHPKPLFDHLARRTSTRLGLYFESLWQYYWQDYSNQRLLEHNLQISKNGRTLGSLDFVLQDQESVTHVEMAVKFYLLHGDHAEHFHAWIGPNTNDNLGKKLDRLAQHQLPMLHHQCTQSKLANYLNTQVNLQQRLILKGKLFFPLDYSEVLPVQLDHHKDNRWLPLKQLKTLGKSGFYSVIPRNRWLGPAIHHPNLAPLCGSRLQAALNRQISSDGRPRMVAQLEREPDGRWCETRRYCVVPDYWPDAARPSRST